MKGRIVAELRVVLHAGDVVVGTSTDVGLWLAALNGLLRERTLPRMPLPPNLAAIYNAQPQEVKDKLARQLGDPSNTDPVPLCCSTDSTGVEVCIAVENHTQCCAGCAQKYCTHGMTNNDGSVTCFDET